MKMIGIWTPAVTNSRCKSRPLNPGKRTSSSRQAGASGRGLRRNSPAVANAWTLYPTDRIRRSVDRRNAASSSMTITTGLGSSTPHLCLPQGRRLASLMMSDGASVTSPHHCVEFRLLQDIQPPPRAPELQIIPEFSGVETFLCPPPSSKILVHDQDIDSRSQSPAREHFLVEGA